MYIGQKKIKEFKEEGEIVKITYEDNTTGILTKKMFEIVKSEETCDLTQLRDKRVEPIVKEVLEVLRDWGIRASELPYFFTKINESLVYNEDQAILGLWQKENDIKSLEEVDLLMVDKVLKNKKDMPSPYADIKK